MRSTQIPRACAAAALAAALAACDGGTEPLEPLAPTYVLVSIDGSPAPLILADHVREDGTRQRYTMLYDSLLFVSATRVNRRLRADMDTFDPLGRQIPVATTGYKYSGTVLRRRARVIAEYAAPDGAVVPPDTFTLHEGRLVKMGPKGLECAGCAPVRQVEYVYAPGGGAGGTDQE